MIKKVFYPIRIDSYALHMLLLHFLYRLVKCFTICWILAKHFFSFLILNINFLHIYLNTYFMKNLESSMQFSSFLLELVILCID